MICACFGVGLNAIREALASDRRANVEEIGNVAARRHQMRILPAGTEEHRDMNVMLAKRARRLKRSRRAWSRWRGCRCFSRWTGKRAVVAGGTPAAAWKAELLVGGGRSGRGLCVGACARRCWRSRPTRRSGTIAIHRRAWTLDDISRRRHRRRRAAKTTTKRRALPPRPRAAGVPVNVIDKPTFCDFSFGAIVNRSPLVIGISTDGAAPVFGQAIRAKLEALIPRGFARWAEAARRWRSDVKTSGLSFNARRRFWQIFTAHAIDASRAPEPEAGRLSIGC